MPNVIRPEDIAPYPWRAGRVLIRVLGALCAGGGIVTALSLTFLPELAWFDRPPLELRDWLYVLYGLWSLNLCLAGAGLLLVKPFGRWLGATAGIFAAAVSVYPLAYDSLNGLKDWAWAAAAIGGILLAYSLLTPLRPAFAPTPPKRTGPSSRRNG